MLRSEGHVRFLAYGLSALAGYIDAVGFTMVGGFFVSFMSGNTTRMAVGVFTHAHDWKVAGSLILAFLVGVICGSLTGRVARNRHRMVLILVAGLLLLAACMSSLLLPAWPVALVMAAAMGAENAFFERDGEVQIGLTYMTGTLVKTGQRITDAIMGARDGAWKPYAALWAALMSGAILGAMAYQHIGKLALWLAVLVLIPAIFAAKRLDREQD